MSIYFLFIISVAVYRSKDYVKNKSLILQAAPCGQIFVPMKNPTTFSGAMHIEDLAGSGRSKNLRIWPYLCTIAGLFFSFSNLDIHLFQII